MWTMSFSVQSEIFPRLKAQILQIRYQNILEGLGFTVERKNRIIISIIIFSEILSFLNGLNHNFPFDICFCNWIHTLPFILSNFASVARYSSYNSCQKAK